MDQSRNLLHTVSFRLSTTDFASLSKLSRLRNAPVCRLLRELVQAEVCRVR